MRASAASGPQIVTTNDNVVLDVADRTFDLIKITCRADKGPLDALILPSGCRNVTIKRLELDTWCADGIKCQNAGTPAHHVTVNGGWARGHARVGEVHQDGIQTMGGTDLVFNNVAFDFVGGGGGCLFIAQGGSGAGTPMRMTFNHCAIGPSHPNCCRLPSGTGHKLTNCLVFRPYSGREAISPGGFDTGTQLRNPVPIDQAWAVCLDYVDASASAEPPPQSGEPPPIPDQCDDIAAELQATKSLLAASVAEAAALRTVVSQANLKEAEIDRLLAEAAAMDVVPG